MESEEISFAEPLVESEPVELKREPWLKDDWQPLRRMRTVAHRRKLDIILICNECSQMLTFENGPGGPIMTCECKRREVVLV